MPQHEAQYTAWKLVTFCVAPRLYEEAVIAIVL